MQNCTPIHMPNKIWTQIGIDLMVTLKETEEGYRYILTVIDYFTKYMELILAQEETGARGWRKPL